MSETVKNNETATEVVETKIPEPAETMQHEVGLGEETSASADDSTFGAPVKRRRTSKVDSQLANAKETALRALSEIADPTEIGLAHHLRAEEERLTTHLFECLKPGYRGWFWFATLSRAPRTKVATVCEVGLLPGDDALLAPAWVPWAERMKDISDAEKAELEGIEEFENFDDFEDAEIASIGSIEDEEPAEITEEIEELVELDHA